MICAFGDALVDVIMMLSKLPVIDDDVPGEITLSAGGQAANVAAWCVALGAPGRVVTKLADDPAGMLVRALLEEAGVEVLAAPGQKTGTVTSMVTPDGKRSMASDRGANADFAPEDLDRSWFDGCSWLHLSGYALFGEHSTDAATRASELARRSGARVSVDLSSALLVAAFGRARVRQAIESCGATLVFANEAEHEAAGRLDVVQTVVKRGAAGCTVIEAHGRRHRHRALPPVAVNDTTGAGDAFAAGWLAGGPPLALEAARMCVATTGAMPPKGLPRARWRRDAASDAS